MRWNRDVLTDRGLNGDMKNLLTTADYSREDLERFIDAALQFKQGTDVSRPLLGRSVALVFFNPSLRTRASMQVGIYELGGNAVVLEPGGTSWTLEHRDGVVMDHWRLIL